MLQDHFFANFRNFQKKLPVCKKMYAEILNVDRSVVTYVGKNEKRIGRNFLGSDLEGQSVVRFCTKFHTPTSSSRISHSDECSSPGPLNSIVGVQVSAILHACGTHKAYQTINAIFVSVVCVPGVCNY